MDVLRDFLGYLRAHRRWWIVPLILAILVVSILVAVAVASPITPFIYPLF